MSWMSSAAQAVGSVVNGIQQRNAAQSAAKSLESGAMKAQATAEQNQTAANTAQQTALSNVTSAEQPYQGLGSTSANALSGMISGGGFQAPTLAQAEQTPGYQFQLQQGTQALNENAAANGTLMSGNTGVALEKYGQNLAQGAYQQTYNNALNAYQTNANTALQGSQVGLGSTGQLAQTNLGVAGNTANIDLTSAAAIEQQQNNYAAAQAGGSLGSAAAWSGMISGLQNAASSYPWKK